MEEKLQPKKRELFKDLNKRLAITSMLFLISFFAIQFYVTASSGTSNAEIESIRFENDRLRLENEILSANIDKITSTPNLLKIAEKYNLVEKNVVEISAESLDNVAANL